MNAGQMPCQQVYKCACFLCDMRPCREKKPTFDLVRSCADDRLYSIQRQCNSLSYAQHYAQTVHHFYSLSILEWGSVFISIYLVLLRCRGWGCIWKPGKMDSLSKARTNTRPPYSKSALSQPVLSFFFFFGW